jgi:hypothetical protein
MVSIADFDSIRSLAAGSISGSYAAVGTPLDFKTRGVCLTNDTQGSMMFTNDVTKDKVFVKAGSFKLWDVQANMNAQFDNSYILPINTQWYVKQLEAPVDGNVYVESLIGY